MNTDTPREQAPVLPPRAESGIKVGIVAGNVTLEFDHPVQRIKFTPRQARQVAEALRQTSHKAQKR